MKKTLLILLLCLVTTFIYARKIYFSSSTGSDSYNVTQVQNPNTPWKTLVRLQNFGAGYYSTGVFPNKAAAGDTFLFKRGDVFANGIDDFGSVKWWGGGYGFGSGYNCPSGTPNNPIVFTYYGDNNLPLPNFLFPFPANTINKNRHVLTFANVSNIVVDGIMVYDTRFPYKDKITSAYCAIGVQAGARASDAEGIPGSVQNFTIKNCVFSNIGYGVGSCGDYIEISNCHFSNFKSCGDTIGINDIGADALLPTGGKYYRILNNYISGSWAYANPNSSSGGLLGGGLESVNDFDSSILMYNIFVDNSGGMEFGSNQTDRAGPNEVLFAYNLFVNNVKVCYINTVGSVFSCRASKIRFYNNVIIENDNCRFAGVNFGGDSFGDGQSFSTFNFWPQYPVSPSVDNYTGLRMFQYGSDNILDNPDTLLDIRNNIIWITTGVQAKYSNRTKIFYRNNLYHCVGGDVFPSAIGGTLGTGELSSINNKIFIDTSSINPLKWDFHLTNNSPAIGTGVNVGLSKDFAGISLISGSAPDIGIYRYSAKPLLAVSSITNITCKTATNGSVTVVASGGTGPYLYKLANRAYQSSGTFSSLAPGTYPVTVKDTNGVTGSLTITIKGSNVVCP